MSSEVPQSHEPREKVSHFRDVKIKRFEDLKVGEAEGTVLKSVNGPMGRANLNSHLLPTCWDPQTKPTPCQVPQLVSLIISKWLVKGLKKQEMDFRPEMKKSIFPVPRTNALARLEGGPAKTIEGSWHTRKHIKEEGRQSTAKRNSLFHGPLMHFALQKVP